MIVNFEVITVMFEELKTLLLTISKKLDNNEVAPQRADPADTSKIEEMIRRIEKPDISKVEQMVGTMVEVYEKTRNVTLHQNDKISKSLTALQEKEAIAPPPQRHLHTVELKSSKVVITLVTLSFILLASLISNLYQWRENSTLLDSDMKYRYIKAHQGIGKNDLHTLETIFEYEPDTQKQQSLCKWVTDYERAVKERAEDLERAKLKEAESERLRKEADELKQGK